MSALPLHFEFYGTVNKVLRELGEDVPIYLPEQPPEFLANLNRLIKKVAIENQWDEIVLDISRNMARHILNDLTQHPFPHKGGVFVDPTGSTPEHCFLENDRILKCDKEHMIQVNEATDDILIILFGVEGINETSNEIGILQRHVRLMGVIFSLLMEEDEAAYEERAQRGIISQQDRKMKQAREKYFQFAAAVQKIEDPESSEQSPINSANVALASLAMTLQSLVIAPENASLKQYLSILLHQIHDVPESYAHMGFDLTPFIDEKTDVIGLENRRAAPLQDATATKDAAPTAVTPQHPHHLKMETEPEPE